MQPPTNYAPRDITRASMAIVAFCFFMHMLARGLSETIAVFLLPVIQEMGWSRTEFSSIYAIFMATHGITAPFIGAMFDRFGPKWIYIPAIICLGLGYQIASHMQHLWHAQLGLGILIGLAVSGMGMAVATGVISRWFDKNLTIATSITYAGMSVGMIAVAPLSQELIETFGWRDAYFYLSLPPLILAPLLILLPWKRITFGYKNQKPISSKRFLIPAYVLKQPTFWGLFISFYATAVAIWNSVLQIAAYLVEIGFSPILAATGFGTMGAMSMVGMLLVGYLADRYQRHWVITISFLMTVLGIICIWFLQFTPTISMMFISVMMFGSTMGSRGPVISALVAKLYPQMVGAVYGMITIAFGLGAATGGMLSGFLHDVSGGYDVVFAASIIACLIGLAPYWILYTLKYGRWPHS